MSVGRRILLILAALLVLAGALFIALAILPSVRHCLSISCGSSFHSGVVVEFGWPQFTLTQTVLMIAGIGASASLLALAVVPRHRWTSIGVGMFAMALTVALAIPPYATGAIPTKACSTPGPDGPIWGRCSIGDAPMDDRLGTRALLMLAGLGAITLGVMADRRRLRVDDPQSMPRPAI